MSDMVRRDRWSTPPWSPPKLGGDSGGGYLPRRVQGIQHLAAWKNEAGETLWIRRLIGTLFQSFVSAALPGQPAAEMLPHTAQLWVDVLLDMNLTEDDTGRIQVAGRKLLRELEEWPQVKALIARMPARSSSLAARNTTSHELRAESGPTEQDREASKDALRKIREML